MSTSLGYHETSGDIMMHVGDIISMLAAVQYIRVFSINERLL